jgi:predicted NUDIX family NTP pyrophosphohydrolase
MSEKRKTFYLNSDESKPVTSAGVLLYRYIKGNMEVLMADARGTFEDLGGIVDTKDKDIMSTATREAFEESNGLINKRKLKSRIKTAPFVYVEKMKYVVYIVKANNDEKNLTMADFGKIEVHDNIPRTIQWFPVNKIIFDKLNWRIKNRKIFDTLKEIKNEDSISVGIFSTSDEDASKDEKPKTKTKK